MGRPKPNMCSQKCGKGEASARASIRISSCARQPAAAHSATAKINPTDIRMLCLPIAGYRPGRPANEHRRQVLLLILFCRLDADEYFVPPMMLARPGETATAEGSMQQFDVRDLILFHPSPVRKFLAAGAADLISKKLHHAVMNSVIVRFDDALLVFVDQADQALLVDCGPEQEIDRWLGNWHRITYPLVSTRERNRAI